MQAIAAALYLTCHGTTLQSVPIETDAVAATDNSGGQASGASIRKTVERADVSVGFRLDNGVAKLRIPSELRPSGTSGGDAGWYSVKNLVVNDREITGKAVVNFWYHPTFRIDRITGELSSSGGFSATCAPEDTSKRKF